jgi:hypothetical protein
MFFDILRSPDFKAVVDTLSSIASILAIFTVMIAWFRTARKALKIHHVVYYKHQDQLAYIVRFKNIKSYPVTIKYTRCYTNRSFTIEIPSSLPPNFSSGFHPFNVAIMDSNEHVIEPFGSTEITYISKCKPSKIRHLIFDLGTSHGDMFIKCNKVNYFEMDATVTVNENINKKVFVNKYKAIFYYYWQKLCHWNKS